MKKDYEKLAENCILEFESKFKFTPSEVYVVEEADTTQIFNFDFKVSGNILEVFKDNIPIIGGNYLTCGYSVLAENSDSTYYEIVLIDTPSTFSKIQYKYSNKSEAITRIKSICSISWEDFKSRLPEILVRKDRIKTIQELKK